MSKRNDFQEDGDPDQILQDMDMTMVGESPEYYDVLDRVNVEDATKDNNISATMALRKNLSGAFDLYAPTGVCLQVTKPNKRSSVKEKIEAFERATCKTSSSVSHANHEHETDAHYKCEGKHQPNLANQQQHSRPPALPTKTNNGKDHSVNVAIRPSLLSVYLRIRPPTKRVHESGKEDNITNTVEIVADSNNNPTCKIRTYPPYSSNSAKVVRGCLNQHNTVSSNHYSSNLENYGMMKGVKEFEFTRVFDTNTSQQEIYEDVAAPLVEGLFPEPSSLHETGKLVGNSALLFAYGITNAGKTHTMVGQNIFQSSERNHVEGNRDAGIIPRSLSHILSTISSLNNRLATMAPNAIVHDNKNHIPSKERQPQLNNMDPISKRISYHLLMSYFEIYNEQIIDLLPKEKRPRPGQLLEESLKIRETRNNRTYVGGLAKHHVKDVTTGLELLRTAIHKRRTCSNNINHDSSRSHSICQFEIVAVSSSAHAKNQSIVEDDNISSASDAMGYTTDEENGASDTSSRRSVHMWIVDLAGSERSKRTGILHKASRQKESALINSSLMKLMRCFQVIADNQKASATSSSLVPFRESKLTHLFMAHLTGSPISRTSMIVNINPSVDDYDETQHVLSYASVARNINMSEAEYMRKRRAIQISDSGHSHVSTNQTNHSHTDESKSPPRKLSRLVQKLSPRALLAKRKNELMSSSTAKDVVTVKDITAKNMEDKSIRPGEHDNSSVAMNGLDEENQSLRHQIREYQDMVEHMRLEKIELAQRLDECETKIRNEVAEETETQIIYLRKQHDEIVNRLRQQYQTITTPSKSAKKVQSDKAAQLIVEYMEKIDECEEEMQRMRASHESELIRIKSLCQQEIDAKDCIVSELQNRLSSMERENHETISKLEHALASARREIVTLRHENETFIDLSNIESSVPSSSDQEGLYDEDDPVLKNKENLNIVKAITSPSAPSSVRRLPRPRCSEVACANISPNSMMIEQVAKQSSSSKKKQGFVPSINKSKDARLPFEQSIVKPDFCDYLQDDDDIMYPSSQPEYDELTGRYQRPRGRAPTGRVWDCQIGGWRRH